MTQPGLVLAGLLALGVLFVLVPVAAATYAWLRPPRRLRCPELGRDAAVAVDAPHGAWTSLFGRARLRVGRCSRWPERAGCRQGCLQQPLGGPPGVPIAGPGPRARV
jgi:hypothetical protein